jgi:hypothetical protein
MVNRTGSIGFSALARTCWSTKTRMAPACSKSFEAEMRLDQAARSIFLKEFVQAFLLSMRYLLQAEGDAQLPVREGRCASTLPGWELTRAAWQRMASCSATASSGCARATRAASTSISRICRARESRVTI